MHVILIGIQQCIAVNLINILVHDCEGRAAVGWRTIIEKN